MTLTQERLKGLLDYNPFTGVFYWRQHSRKSFIGRRADSLFTTKGRQYRRIRLDGGRYFAHRLAFIWMQGEWPSGLIDHEDGDGQNNRWNNLRDADRSQNRANAVCRSNKTGLKGVTCIGNRYTARIGVHGKRFHLGSFDTPSAAHAAYLSAAERYFGEFARAA